MVESFKRPVPVPIGQDNLNFKNDPEIMSKLDAGGKLNLNLLMNWFRVPGLFHQGFKIQQVRL